MADMMAARALLTTREVADYLRIKERKVYDLVRERRIPCIRVTGKWLFPKALIELWVIQNSEGRAGQAGSRASTGRGGQPRSATRMGGAGVRL
jgi:excisionase family DNA binding protein